MIYIYRGGYDKKYVARMSLLTQGSITLCVPSRSLS